jgi:Na+/melibiose symporter-like transporter
LVAFYPLNEARMSKIETELKARRAGDTPVWAIS